MDGLVDDSSNFIAEAKTAVLAARTNLAAGTNVMDIDGGAGAGPSEYETCESAGSVGTGGEHGGVGKKTKKKRWRKRVGH
jgi:hypothetical protein